MNDPFANGYAERVPGNELQNKDHSTWYIPYHGVYHPKKPGENTRRFRLQCEIQGGVHKPLSIARSRSHESTECVLCRFRQDPIAFMCDVESMLHHFKVVGAHRNLLRFFWWKDGGTTKPPIEYRMTIHLFGAGSSPSCPNYMSQKDRRRPRR